MLTSIMVQVLGADFTSEFPTAIFVCDVHLISGKY